MDKMFVMYMIEYTLSMIKKGLMSDKIDSNKESVMLNNTKFIFDLKKQSIKIKDKKVNLTLLVTFKDLTTPITKDNMDFDVTYISGSFRNLNRLMKTDRWNINSNNY